MIEDAIYTHLASDADLAALVSTKVYPHSAPQRTLMPYLIYRRLHSEHLEHLGGSAGTCRALFEFSAWSTSYATAREIAEKIRLALQGFSGTVGAVEIEGTNLIGDDDLHEPPKDGGDLGRHAAIVEYAIWYGEAIPSFS